MAQFLDTNVLLYSISRNPAETAKRERAIQLLDDDTSAVSIQVLQEFYVQATPLVRNGSPAGIARSLRRTMRRLSD